LLSWPLIAQLNLKAGYNLSFLDAPGYNAIVEAHNLFMDDTYIDPFKPLDILHGLDLGLEYRWEALALEAGWRIKRNRQVASGSTAQRAFTNKLNCSLGSFYVGLVQYYGPVRIASSVDFNYKNTKIDFENPSTLHVIKDNSWGSTFSLGYVIPGKGGISIVLAPYVQLHWSDYELDELQMRLTELNTPPPQDDFLNYGITLYFLNGPR
jgi:hypothetical protein